MSSITNMASPTGPRSSDIQNMFRGIAHKYDRANNALSLGIHNLWKKRLIEASGVRPGQKVLDCATGTGDLAFAFAKKVGSSGQVTGTDFCEDMLKVAQEKKQLEAAPLTQLSFESADVTSLPYADASFDVASIAFGIRNVEMPLKALSELGRVVKPGGRVLVLEFGQPPHPWMKTLYRLYSERILPTLGGWITGQKSAYRYLEESSSRFPCGQEFVHWMEDTGRFSEITCHTLTGGIAYLYVGVRQWDSV